MQERLWRLGLAFFRLARPQTWLLTMAPCVFGFVLATRSLTPPPSQGAALLAALACLGPLHWAASLGMNDVQDLANDRRNPRKRLAPLVRGDVTVRQALRLAALASGLAMMLAAAVSWMLAAWVAACLLLAMAYNLPPVRTKGRPGLDVVTNMARIGVVPILAGWTLGAPLAQFPFHWLVKGTAVAAAVYIPTMLLDHDYDKEAGLRTVATALGVRRAYRIGLAAWVIAGALTLESAWRGGSIPHGMFPFLAVLVPFQVVLYHVAIGQARSQLELVRGIFLCSACFAMTGVLFMMHYTGIWRL